MEARVIEAMPEGAAGIGALLAVVPPGQRRVQQRRRRCWRSHGGPCREPVEGGDGTGGLRLSGADGSDVLVGEEGDDEIHGGLGNDWLMGAVGVGIAAGVGVGVGIVTGLVGTAIV